MFDKKTNSRTKKEWQKKRTDLILKQRKEEKDKTKVKVDKFGNWN